MRIDYSIAYLIDSFLLCSGFGETSMDYEGNKEDFLNSVIATLKMKNVVIVSPSMSGSYSIPFLLKFSNSILGYVPVAPVSTEKLRGHEKDILVCAYFAFNE